MLCVWRGAYITGDRELQSHFSMAGNVQAADYDWRGDGEFAGRRAAESSSSRSGFIATLLK